ncbi:MAG: hypothetical protein ACR2KL_09525 [Nocardioidaceae bacterium]
MVPADRPEDVDEAFARLVAGYDTPPDARLGGRGPWPESEDLGDAPTVDPQPEPAATSAESSRALDLPSSTDPLNTEASWEDEGHFVPPPPPPLPRPEPLRFLAWLGVLVGPLVMVAAAVLVWPLPRFVTGALIAGFVGGVAFLIATMSNEPADPHDPDHGAVV